MATKKKTTKSTKNKQSFWTWRWSIETVYWLVLLLLVLAMGAWVMQLTVQTQKIYDKVQSINASETETIQPKNTNPY